MLRFCNVIFSLFGNAFSHLIQILIVFWIFNSDYCTASIKGCLLDLTSWNVLTFYLWNNSIGNKHSHCFQHSPNRNVLKLHKIKKVSRLYFNQVLHTSFFLTHSFSLFCYLCISYLRFCTMLSLFRLFLSFSPLSQFLSLLSFNSKRLFSQLFWSSFCSLC